MKKMRTLIEGPEWEESRAELDLSPETFDDVFRFAAFNVSTEPLVNVLWEALAAYRKGQA